jgi:hypothetical protein
MPVEEVNLECLRRRNRESQSRKLQVLQTNYQELCKVPSIERRSALGSKYQVYSNDVRLDTEIRDICLSEACSSTYNGW